MARHPHTAAGRGFSGRDKATGYEHKGHKSPFAGASPTETAAPGEHFRNSPKGPRLNGGAAMQGGGGLPAQSVDRASKKDEAKHGA